MYNYMEFGSHKYSYNSTSSGEVEIYDNKKLVAKVDNLTEAKEWIDEEFRNWQKENKIGDYKE